jgi:glycosyltransferase involved in cell wall biosynthesis
MRRPVSALLPIKDGEKWITRAINNLNNTLMSNDEIVIIDDGSTDKTLEILKKADFKCPIKIVSNRNPGLVNALNLGISEAKNLWIARYDVDDQYIDDRVDIQISALEDNVVAIFSDYQIFSEEGAYLGYIPSPITHLAIYLSLLKSERNAHPSVIFRKDAVLKVGGYLEQDFPCEDLSLWLRLAQVGELKGVPTPILKYNLRRSSVSGSRYREAKNKMILVINDYFDFKLNIQISDIDKTLRTYNCMTLSLQRSLLLMRDLMNLNSRVKIQPKVKLFILKNTLYLGLNLKFFPLLIRELKYRAKRRRYR